MFSDRCLKRRHNWDNPDDCALPLIQPHTRCPEFKHPSEGMWFDGDSPIDIAWDPECYSETMPSRVDITLFGSAETESELVGMRPIKTWTNQEYRRGSLRDTIEAQNVFNAMWREPDLIRARVFIMPAGADLDESPIPPGPEFLLVYNPTLLNDLMEKRIDMTQYLKERRWKAQSLATSTWMSLENPDEVVEDDDVEYNFGWSKLKRYVEGVITKLSSQQQASDKITKHQLIQVKRDLGLVELDQNSTASSSSTSNSNSNTGGVSTGGIAAIVVVTVIVLVGLLFLGVYLFKDDTETGSLENLGSPEDEGDFTDDELNEKKPQRGRARSRTVSLGKHKVMVPFRSPQQRKMAKKNYKRKPKPEPRDRSRENSTSYGSAEATDLRLRKPSTHIEMTQNSAVPPVPQIPAEYQTQHQDAVFVNMPMGSDPAADDDKLAANSSFNSAWRDSANFDPERSFESELDMLTPATTVPAPAMPRQVIPEEAGGAGAWANGGPASSGWDADLLMETRRYEAALQQQRLNEQHQAYVAPAAPPPPPESPLKPRIPSKQASPARRRLRTSSAAHSKSRSRAESNVADEDPYGAAEIEPSTPARVTPRTTPRKPKRH